MKRTLNAISIALYPAVILLRLAEALLTRRDASCAVHAESGVSTRQVDARSVAA